MFSALFVQLLTRLLPDPLHLLFVLVSQKRSARLALHSSKIVWNSIPLVCIRNSPTIPGLEDICNIAIQILEQKAFCQQDPDQDEEEDAPEDQAEYDSVLISSAGDLVAALASGLGPDFGPAFSTFFPLIAKYYVCHLLC